MIAFGNLFQKDENVKSLVNIIRIIEPTAKEALRIKNEKDSNIGNCGGNDGKRRAGAGRVDTGALHRLRYRKQHNHQTAAAER